MRLIQPGEQPPLLRAALAMVVFLICLPSAANAHEFDARRSVYLLVEPGAVEALIVYEVRTSSEAETLWQLATLDGDARFGHPMERIAASQLLMAWAIGTLSIELEPSFPSWTLGRTTIERDPRGDGWLLGVRLSAYVARTINERVVVTLSEGSAPTVVMINLAAGLACVEAYAELARRVPAGATWSCQIRSD